MKYRFLQENITKDNIIEKAADIATSVLLENNRGQINKILDFFNSQNSLLLATGFLGTGKTSVIKHCLEVLNEDAVLLWANCYESTNLDDIFLEFFEEFKHLASHDIIKVPQAKFENFSQRINAYFYSISKPIVIVLNSYQALLPENAKLLLDFIGHLSEFAKIKTIIISRNFNTETLPKNTKFEKISFKALDKELFQKYITANKIRIHGPVFEEFYKLTKGYYFYTTLALIIINTQRISPIELMQKHANSFLSLKEFLFREFLSMVDSVGGHLIRFLTVIRYPVNTKLLQSLNLYDEARLQMFAANYLIEIEHGNIYLKDYYKDITEGEIPPNVLVKLHKACVELYEMQLPRKPEERDLLISRRTIRQEIEYHKLFIPKKVDFSNSVEVYNAQALMVKPAATPPEPKKVEKPATQPPVPPKKELKDLLFVFDEKEEDSLLTGIADSINEFIAEAQAQDEAEYQMNTEELLKLINDAEDEYNYQRVISLCEKIILKNETTKDLQAYSNNKMAMAYANLSDAYNALKHFTAAKELYQSLNDTQNLLENNFYIAKMNYLMFKRDAAKQVLANQTKDMPKALQIKSNLLLFDIYMEEGDEDKAFDTCKETMKLVDKTQEPATICELLFKCGVILESRGNNYRAIEAYEKALKFNIEKFLPQIYSNLTTLYVETENLELAKKYCQKALETATSTEEVYTASLKLAQLSPENAAQCYETALKCATELQDNFYITSALTAYGDYLYGKTQIIEALEKYLSAHKYAKNNFIKENIQTIEKRILDVKYRVTEEIFNKKAKEFNYEQ